MLQVNNVEKPIQMLVREAEVGKPFEELLVDLYERHRNYERVAGELRVSPATLYVWLRLLGIRKRALEMVVVERMKAAREASSVTNGQKPEAEAE